MDTDALVKVKIFGTEYRVRGEADEAYIRKIAAYVDLSMKQIADSGRHISPERIAVLAAFNIADELHQTRGQKERKRKDEEFQAARLLKLFEDEPGAQSDPSRDSS